MWVDDRPWAGPNAASSATTDFEFRLRALERRVVDLQLTQRSQRRWRDKFRPTLFNAEQYPPRDWSMPAHYFASTLPPRPPTITIVTPSLDQGAFIERTIRSVLAQNYPSTRYIVQDGGSRDETRAILKAYEHDLSWTSERDDGQAHAINRGFAGSEGELMAWLNSDDLLLPGTLRYVASFFSEHPEVDIVYGQRLCIDSADKEIGRVILPAHDADVLKWVDVVPQETLFWRRRVWDKLGGLDQSFQYALDWDFILRAQLAGFRFYRLPRFLGCFRVHPRQKTARWPDISERETARLRERHIGRCVTPKEINRAIAPYLRRHVVTVRAYKLGLIRF